MKYVLLQQPELSAACDWSTGTHVSQLSKSQAADGLGRCNSTYVNQNSDTNCCVSQYWCQNLETLTQWTVHFTLPQWSLINTFPPQSYVYVLYPMSAVAFCASIYMTLAVTVERWVEYIYLPNKNIFGQFVNINNKQVHVWQWPVNSRLCDLTWSLNVVHQ